ncbi:MAG: sulfotransferase [Woeseiaceae bacterium]
MSDRAPARDVIDRLVALAGEGRTDLAERECRSRLSEHPGDVNLKALLGAILLKNGAIGEAEPLLLEVIRQEPGFAKPHEDLGMLYLSRGDAERAAGCFEKALAIDASLDAALYGLATALERCGRYDEAAAARQRYVAGSPAARVLAEAARHFEEGRPDQAEKLCGEILSREPRDLNALRLLARIAADDGRSVIADGLYRRILKLAPDFHLAHADYAQFLAECSRFHEAAGMFERARTLQPRQAELERRLADVLAIVGRTKDALAAWQRSLAIEPRHPRALVGRGHMLRILGRRDEAVASYAECAELEPAYGEAWWSLASMRGFRFDEGQLQTMEAQCMEADTDPPSRVALLFAIARAFESNGDYANAWEYYRRGNTDKRGQVRYDPVETEAQVDARIKVFDREVLARPQRAKDDSTPICIVGMPRSGSTLIEQILASHSRVEGCGELPYMVMLSTALGEQDPDGLRYPEILRELPPERCEALGREYLRHAASHRRKETPYFTDKMPANFLHVGFIHLVLPDAVIIDARRDPLDTCVGNYRQLFAQGKNQSYDLQELGEYYLQYLRLMEHWDAVLPGRVLRVQYEDVVGDLDAQVRCILDHCGLPFEEACLDFHRSPRAVNTASAEQVREPVYTDAVGYWKHYEEHLDELKEILAPVLPSRP